MSPSPSLTDLKNEFAHWRQTKKSPQSRVPDSLRRQAVALRDHYSDRDITRALKINAKRLRSWAGDPPLEPTEPSLTESITEGFISLPMPEANNTNTPPITLTSTNYQGLPWTLQGTFSPAQLSAIVATLTQTQSTRGGDAQ